MPIFDFRCQDCSEEYQKMVSHSKKDEVTCPSCGSKNKEQLFIARIKGPVSSSSSSSSSSYAPVSSGFT
ncbi:MAG: zinc ribbon domain-containing protein [Bacillaceae bacterium]|nr:zinc ribbon domain-containing protein [Bacillaceae bacterium]